MIIFRRWYKVLKQVVGRFRSGQAARMVRALMVDSSAGKLRPDDQGVAYRSQSEDSRPLLRDIRDQDHRPVNRPVIDDFPVSAVNRVVKNRTNQDIDATGFDNLEDYVEGLNIPEETISKWVSAGILSPRETEVAEKVIRIMRKKIP